MKIVRKSAHKPQGAGPKPPRSLLWTNTALKKSSKSVLFWVDLLVLENDPPGYVFGAPVGGFTVHGSQFTAHDSRLTAHTKNSNQKRLHNTKQQARQHTTTKQLQQPTTTNTTTTLLSYRSCLTCSLHDLATTPLSHHAFKKRGRRHGGEAL